MFFTRDLVSEPANVLYPVEFARRAKELTKLGVKVQILGEAEMKKLGLNVLLAVGQGSARESQLLVMTWMNGPKNQKPIALIGKGVCFDTGGISIKPAAGMEDMKGDMGGAANVIALMRAVVALKPDVEVHGLVATAENMPDGNAYRPEVLPEIPDIEDAEARLDATIAACRAALGAKACRPCTQSSWGLAPRPNTRCWTHWSRTTSWPCAFGSPTRSRTVTPRRSWESQSITSGEGRPTGAGS